MVCGYWCIVDAVTPQAAVDVLTNEEGGKLSKMGRMGGAVRCQLIPRALGGWGMRKMKRLLEETLAKRYTHFRLRARGNP